uniref:Uncharacterized protein n=1 Tax=Rhizophora mucronata TaxID=61149 RepID=A0A2P2R1E9_RHIMU
MFFLEDPSSKVSEWVKETIFLNQ